MSVSITAQIILDQTGYTTTDFTLINTEYMIDDALDTVNLMFTQSIAALSGSTGSKTGSLTRDQNAVVKMLLVLMLREGKKTSLSNSTSTGGSTSNQQSVGVGAISISESGSVSSAVSAAQAINNPANSIYVSMFMDAGKKLEDKTSVTSNRRPPIVIANDLS